MSFTLDVILIHLRDPSCAFSLYYMSTPVPGYFCLIFNYTGVVSVDLTLTGLFIKTVIFFNF